MPQRALDTVPQRALAALRSAVDALLVGQEVAKTGCLLALLARQHVHLEGPPGCGKSALAEGLAVASGARAVHAAIHTAPGCDALLGQTVLLRRVTPRGEQLSLRRDRARLADAELLVLDDLPRAPAEAVQPLLRAITERRLAGAALPLECAVSTAPAPGPESVHDPMEPAALDRFAVQIRMHGLLTGACWRDARRLMDAARPPGVAAIDTRVRHQLQASAREIEIPALVREALLGLAARLASLRAPDGTVLVSDRTLVSAALPLLRAHALLRGADAVALADLAALRFMLGRRVPETLLPLAEELVEEAARGATSVAAATRVSSPDGASAAGSSREGASREIAAAVAPPGTLPAVRAAVPQAADVRALLRVLEGRLEPGFVGRALDRAGAPRRQARLVRLDELDDADPIEALLFVDGSLPENPRVLRRARRRAAGALAVLRDVSASMEGEFGRAASQVVTGLVRLGARRRMRMGYLEFHHEAQPFEVGGQFFHRRYGRLLALAARARSEGRTSYEAPLRAALAAFGGSSGDSRHIVLLTDGLPVVGDPEVVRERALARRLGIRVHTVFMGSAAPPPILDRLARETGGVAFVLGPGAGGRLRVRERGAA